MLNDTIVALATPIGISSIFVLRVSGPKAVETVSRLCKSQQELSEAPSHTVHYAHFYDNADLLDEVLITVFRQPHSYTGEDVVEISGHGSPYIAGQMLEIFLRYIRMANPGEFTLRAFLNHKMDLTKAEAVNDLIHSQTKMAHKSAMNQLEGSLYHRLEVLLKELTIYRKQLELEIDFLEQELPEIDVSKLKSNLHGLENELSDLIDTGRQGKIIREGLKVVLTGEPNVGKSSIFNAFLRTERAIVTPVPGTTRDFLEEAISMEGYLIRFFDTAGLRITKDQVEKKGIEKTLKIMQDADIVLYITDSPSATQTSLPHFTPVLSLTKIIPIFNKTDLFSETEIQQMRKQGFVPCSTLSESSMKELKEVLLEEIRVSETNIVSGLLTNTRHLSAAKKALHGIDQAITSLEDELGFEFTAFDLKEASHALEEIVGIISTDELLHQIFSEFCVGK